MIPLSSTGTSSSSFLPKLRIVLIIEAALLTLSMMICKFSLSIAVCSPGASNALRQFFEKQQNGIQRLG